MELKPTGAALGAEVTGVDLTRPLPESDRQRLRDGLARYGVLFVRGQRLDPAQFVQYARNFGEIERYDSTLAKYLLPEQPEIIVLSNIEKDGKPIGVVD